MPADHQLPERLRAVLDVLYGLFNEGYSASAGANPIRKSLCAEAIRLARLLVELMPDEPEALGLLSMIVFHDRRPRRPIGWRSSYLLPATRADLLRRLGRGGQARVA